MTTKRLIILQALVLLGLSCIFLLPPSPKQQPVGVELQLPDFLGEWYGQDAAVTEREIQVLGPDTGFARKIYTNSRGDSIFVSIVLAGQDMNTSIHRPERCLPAQGWTIADSRVVAMPVNDAGGNPHYFKATRMHNMRRSTTVNGTPVGIYSLNYYWFVGSTDVTPSHMSRTFLDIRDRLLKGYNQRWAYVTVVSAVTKGIQEHGRSEAETDTMIQEFVKQLVPKIQKPSVQLG